jgi:hypothetical protein
MTDDALIALAILLILAPAAWGWLAFLRWCAGWYLDQHERRMTAEMAQQSAELMAAWEQINTRPSRCSLVQLDASCNRGRSSMITRVAQ